MADKEFLSPVTLAVLKLKNTANTFTNLFSNATTAARTWTLPDKSGTVALSSDLTDLAQLLNPVGTIREFNVSTNPATLLGFGTWTLHGVGRVTVCIDTGQTEFDTLGETGGAKTHTLTTTQLPYGILGVNASNSGFVQELNGIQPGTGFGWIGRNIGGGTAHNNLQPYIVVYRWVRTA